MKFGNILIVAAHLDDVEVGIGGWLSNLSEEISSNITTFTTCHGLGGKDKNRVNTFIENMKLLNIHNNIISDYNDTELTDANIDFLKPKLSSIIETHKIDTVFVINADDHKDHQKVYDMVKICTRQSRTAVKRVYAYQVYTNFNLNEFNVSLPYYKELKFTMLKKYNQNINVGAIKNQDLVFGSSTMDMYAERVKLVFDTI